jgi:hypothetical protein
MWLILEHDGVSERLTAFIASTFIVISQHLLILTMVDYLYSCALTMCGLNICEYIADKSRDSLQVYEAILTL